MRLRAWPRVLIAVAFCISGLVETLSATGLVLEFSPDGNWGPGVHTLSASGPLLVVGAALLASGRKTRWALGILGCDIFLVCALVNLPLIFSRDVGGSAVAGLVSNLMVMGGILYWLHSGRIRGVRTARPAPRANPSAAVMPARLLFWPGPSGPWAPERGQAIRRPSALL